LLGQMSLVGPRPDVPGYADCLTGDDRIVLAVRPGITGPATLKYRDEQRLLAHQSDPERYNREVVFPDKVRINREYVRNSRFVDDLKVLWQTASGTGPLAETADAPAEYPPWPQFDDDEIAAVTAVLRSGKVNYWTGGECRAFEREFAEACGCRHGVAVANGTLALEAALHALGIGPGDEVIVPARTFVASASCCLMRGAVPVFADVDRTSGNLTADTARAALTPKTKALIAVHLGGWPCEMAALLGFAAEHNLKVIEDCAQAHGATYLGRPVGSFGHAAAFSFCQDKILSTGGEGGMLVTNDADVCERAWSFKDHGKSRQEIERPGPGGVFRWLHESVGTNWRMTEMQAAVGRTMLPKLPEWVATRRGHAATFTEHLGQLAALRLTPPPTYAGHAYYKYYAYLRADHLRPGWSRDRILRTLQAEGLPCGSGSCPEVYLEKVFADTPMRPERRLPVARELGETSLMFLVHPTLSEQHVRQMCRTIEGVIQEATHTGVSTVRRAA